MENKKHLVAFLDILGFKKLIDEHYSRKNVKALPLLKKALKDAELFAIQYSKRYLKQYKIKFSFKQFSDCVCISMPLTSSLSATESYGIFINVIRQYQFILLDSNILIRGGISIGGHFENSNIIFSDGLVKSYKLESQNAIYPRILIDKELLKYVVDSLIENSEESKMFYQFYGTSLIKDWDDQVFVSPFGFIRNLQKIAIEFGKNVVGDVLSDFSSANKLEKEFSSNVVSKITEDPNFERNIITDILYKTPQLARASRS